MKVISAVFQWMTTVSKETLGGMAVFAILTSIVATHLDDRIFKHDQAPAGNALSTPATGSAAPVQALAPTPISTHEEQIALHKEDRQPRESLAPKQIPDTPPSQPAEASQQKNEQTMAAATFESGPPVSVHRSARTPLDLSNAWVHARAEDRAPDASFLEVALQELNAMESSGDGTGPEIEVMFTRNSATNFPANEWWIFATNMTIVLSDDSQQSCSRVLMVRGYRREIDSASGDSIDTGTDRKSSAVLADAAVQGVRKFIQTEGKTCH